MRDFKAFATKALEVAALLAGRIKLTSEITRP